jgi:hypothetical protein
MRDFAFVRNHLLEGMVRHASWIIGVHIVLAVVLMIAIRALAPVPVTVTPVVRGKAVDAVSATGTIEADVEQPQSMWCSQTTRA